MGGATAYLVGENLGKRLISAQPAGADNWLSLAKMVEKVLLLINLLADLPFQDLHFVIDNARQINKLKNAKPKLKHSLTF